MAAQTASVPLGAQRTERPGGSGAGQGPTAPLAALTGLVLAASFLLLVLLVAPGTGEPGAGAGPRPAPAPAPTSTWSADITAQ